MREVRPGIVMVRRTKKNKLQDLKQKVLIEKDDIVADIQEKYERGAKAVHELQNFSDSVMQYVELLKDKGIDVDYIKNNAEQIRTIFFAVLELLENGEKGLDDKTKKEGSTDG